MLGLGDYDSSDEEDVIQIEPPEKVILYFHLRTEQKLIIQTIG